MAETDHWCRLPGYEDLVTQCKYINATTNCDLFAKTLALPNETVSSACGTKWKFSSCLRYDVNTTDVIDLMNTHDNHTWKTMNCGDKMEYDTSQYTSTAVQEFGFVCDRYYLGPLSTTILLVGPFLANIFMGQLADRIGRRPTLMINITIFVVFGALQSVIRTTVVFFICNFMVGIAMFGMYSQVFVFVSEIVGPSKRGSMTMACVVFYSLGFTVLPLIAFFIRDWSILVLVISVSAAALLSYWWLLSESPRWLLSVGKVEQAKKVLQKMAKVNKVILPESVFEDLNKEKCVLKNVHSEDKHEFTGKVTTGIEQAYLLSRTNLTDPRPTCLRAGSSLSLLYYGLTFNVGNLGGNNYTNALIAGAVEIVAYSSSMYLVETRCGRKLTICISSMIAAIATVSSAFISQCGGTLWVMVAVYMVGKFAATVGYAVSQLYAGELFPTTLRSVGVMSTSSCSILASSLAPLLLPLRMTWNPLPQLVFGGLSIMSAFLVLTLPETRRRKLPANINEAEMFEKKLPSCETMTKEL
ncbi:organic cation transporter protein-like [Saccoglossus kowalevskii]|uniref:Organic cation transporter protein-like n=1 Tax=Saccoglossus kowalevskii TaxID=10224 RepID=A0ABM0LXV0_SACKO|nr:PREDICTED: organic cation transporter protein-like [Saccoglossus kowalevskii]